MRDCYGSFGDAMHTDLISGVGVSILSLITPRYIDRALRSGVESPQ